MSPYMLAIQQAVVIYPIIVLLFTIPYVLFNYHKYGSVFSLRIIVVYSFVLYMLCVYCLVILPLPSAESQRRCTATGCSSSRFPLSAILQRTRISF